MTDNSNVIALPKRKKVGDYATLSFPPGSDSCMVQGQVTAVHSGGEVTINQKHPFEPWHNARGVPN